MCLGKEKKSGGRRDLKVLISLFWEKNKQFLFLISGIWLISGEGVNNSEFHNSKEKTYNVNFLNFTIYSLRKHSFIWHFESFHFDIK